MSKFLHWVIKFWKATVGLIALAALMIWASGGCRAKVAPGQLVASPRPAVPANSVTAAVVAEEVGPRIDVVGTTESEETINLSARIPAYVNEVRVAAGDRVRKGQLLIALDDREIREQLSGAEAQLKQAEREYQRARDLMAKNATTDQALTAAESAFNAARAQVERVRVMLSYTQITAPIDGVVVERRVESGDLANPGQVLVTVYDPLRMRLVAATPVRLIGRLALDQTVEVALEWPPQTLTGRVTEIVSEVDPATRTRKVKVQLATAGAEVLPGTFGRLWVQDAPRRARLAPAAAIYRVGQLEFAQVARDGRLERRLVKTAPAGAGRVEVLSGLAEGETVIVNPAREG